MTAVLLQRQSKQALWSRRVALFSAQVVIVSLVLHRFDLLGSRVATNLFAAGAFGALLAFALAIIAGVRIWRSGLLGGGQAVAGTLISLLLLAGPLWYLPALLAKPKINDITTNFRSPPAFEQIAALRDKDANPVSYPGTYVAEQQIRAYPDIRPMILERSPDATFDLVQEAVARLDWQIVSERKPGEKGSGQIEAVTKTLVMGYRDDVSIRVSGRAGETRIDVRSASRYGEHDFGANAKRIRRLFSEVRAGLEKGERQALDIALEKRAREAREKARELRRLRAKEKKAEEQRLAKLREEAREEELKRLSELQQEALRIELGLDPPGAQDEQEQTARPRTRVWGQDPSRFWQQFAE